MEVSERLRRVEPSATLRISDLASELEQKGEDVVDLSVGEPDFKTPEHIIKAGKKALDEGKTGYAPTKGVQELRKLISRKLKQENNIKRSPEDIIVTPGAKQALFETFQGLIDNGDEVILLDPAWVSYEAMAKLAGGKLKRIKLDPKKGFTLNQEKITEKTSNKTRLLVVNTPSNPSGAVFSKEELKTIRDLAVDHDFWVISDEIYEKLIYDTEHISLASLEGMDERTVTINGFSKAYSMTGWRLGYLAAPIELTNEISKIQSHSVSCAANFVQHAGIKALEGPEKPVHEMRDKFKQRRDIALNLLEDIGVQIPKPQGAFYLFIPVKNENDKEICENLLQQEKVATTPGSAFGIKGYIRVSYANSEDRIKEGINRIKNYL